jgi:hypothetical protein
VFPRLRDSVKGTAKPPIPLHYEVTKKVDTVLFCLTQSEDFVFFNAGDHALPRTGEV